MVETNQLQVLAQLNQEMLNAVTKLRDALNNKNEEQVKKIKELLLGLQKRFSDSIRR